MNEGRYEEALDLFMRAESILPVPTLALRVARAHAQLGHYVQAREAYLRVIHAVLPADSPAAFVEAQDTARAELPDVKAKIAHLTIHVKGPARDRLRVKIDGRPVESALVGLPYPVDPGSHTVEVTAEGFLATSGQSELTAGGQAELRLAMQPDPNAASASAAAATPAVADATSTGAAQPAAADDGGIGAMGIGGLAALGVGAAGVVVGTVFVVQGLDARAQGDALQSECESGGSVCSQTDRDAIDELDTQARGHYTAATVSYIIGGVALAAGVTLLVLDSGDGGSAMTLSPYFTGDSLGVVGTF